MGVAELGAFDGDVDRRHDGHPLPRVAQRAHVLDVYVARDAMADATLVAAARRGLMVAPNVDPVASGGVDGEAGDVDAGAIAKDDAHAAGGREGCVLRERVVIPEPRSPSQSEGDERS